MQTQTHTHTRACLTNTHTLAHTSWQRDGPKKVAGRIWTFSNFPNPYHKLRSARQKLSAPGGGGEREKGRGWGRRGPKGVKGCGRGVRVCAVCFGNEMKMRVKASLMMNAGKVGKQKMPNSKSKIRKRESTQSVLRCKMAGSTRAGGWRVKEAGQDTPRLAKQAHAELSWVGKTFCCLSLIKAASRRHELRVNGMEEGRGWLEKGVSGLISRQANSHSARDKAAHAPRASSIEHWRCAARPTGTTK